MEQGFLIIAWVDLIIALTLCVYDSIIHVAGAVCRHTVSITYNAQINIKASIAAGEGGTLAAVLSSRRANDRTAD